MDNYITCKNCGRQNPPGARFCASCGIAIFSDLPQGQLFDSSSSNNPQYMSSAKQQVISAIQSRTQEDRMLSGLWALWPIFSAIIGIIISVVLILLLYSIGLIIGIIILGVLLAYLVYVMVERQNHHIRREKILRSALIAYFKEKGDENYKSQLISPQITMMEAINQDASYMDEEPSSVLFAFLSIIPIVNFYVIYVLNEFPQNHDRRWNAYTQNVQSIGQQLGMNILVPSWIVVEKRSSALWLILLIVTILIVGIGIIVLCIWYYLIIKDLNEHMQTQWQFEDQLMRELR
jgi:hypothetical protein